MLTGCMWLPYSSDSFLKFYLHTKGMNTILYMTFTLTLTFE